MSSEKKRPKPSKAKLEKHRYIQKSRREAKRKVKSEREA